MSFLSFFKIYLFVIKNTFMICQSSYVILFLNVQQMFSEITNKEVLDNIL